MPESSLESEQATPARPSANDATARGEDRAPGPHSAGGTGCGGGGPTYCAARPDQAAGEGFAAWEVVELVAAEADGAAVAVDAGAHMFAVVWFWRSQRPGRFLISNGLATMGLAVPGALAAALHRPDEPVVAFTGDGGFVLHGAELETARRLGARLVVVVLDDANLSLIRIKQEDRELPRAAVDFGPVAFADMARALGVRGTRAETAPELRAAVRDALAADGPTVVHVPVTGAEYRELVRRIRG